MGRIEWDNPDFREEDIQIAIESLNEHIGAKGEYISRLERLVEKTLDVNYCIAVDNGTSAILASAYALAQKYDIKKVVVPSFSFIASANAPKFIFGDVEFVDIEIDTWNIDANNAKLKEFDLIVAVDVGGLPVDYDRLMALGKIVLADSAESMGSTYKGRLIGSQAHIHTFSLHRSKIISSGEGGLITTQDKDLAELVRSFINHGYDLNKRSWEYKHNTFGLNCRISNVNAALAFSQLNRLDEYVEHRNKLADLYKTRLAGRGFQFQQIPSHSKTNYFLFGVLVDSMFRDNLVELMNAAGVIVKTWPSLSTLDCYDRSPLEISEKIAQSIVLLPISNKTSVEEVELSCDLFLKIYEEISLSYS